MNCKAISGLLKKKDVFQSSKQQFISILSTFYIYTLGRHSPHPNNTNTIRVTEHIGNIHFNKILMF